MLSHLQNLSHFRPPKNYFSILLSHFESFGSIFGQNFFSQSGRILSHQQIKMAQLWALLLKFWHERFVYNSVNTCKQKKKDFLIAFYLNRVSVCLQSINRTFFCQTNFILLYFSVRFKIAYQKSYVSFRGGDNSWNYWFLNSIWIFFFNLLKKLPRIPKKTVKYSKSSRNLMEFWEVLG